MTLYRIPDLEWKQCDSLLGYTIHYAATELDWWCNVWNSGSGWQWIASDAGHQACDSLEDGKAKAEAHYRARMARGLVEVT